VAEARHLPDGEQARLWLFGAARNELHRMAQTLQAGDDLNATLANHFPPLWEEAPDVGDDKDEILDALATLSRLDQEIVTLTAWEELTPREIATVLGLSANVVRIRLHRGRTKLRGLLNSDHGWNLNQRPGLPDAR
jgi:RNA polymerase sigma-70 factor (ECF subfamily)